MLSKRRSRRSRTCIDWCGRPWLANVLFELSITAAIAGSARTGWAGIGKARFVCWAISMVGKVAVDCKRPFAGKLALYRPGEAQQSAVTGRGVAHSAQPFPPANLRRGNRCGCGRLAAPPGSTEGTVRQLPEQLAGDGNPQRGDRVGIMPFGADAASLAGGTPAATPGLVIQYGRCGRRGKNGSAR